MRRVLLVFLAGAFSAKGADYGQKVRFSKGKPLLFPGCQVEFLGERRVPSPVFKPGFAYYDFKVNAGGASGWAP